MRLKKIEHVMRDEPVSDIRRILSYHPELFGQPFSAYLQDVLRGPSASGSCSPPLSRARTSVPIEPELTTQLRRRCSPMR